MSLSEQSDFRREEQLKELKRLAEKDPSFQERYESMKEYDDYVRWMRKVDREDINAFDTFLRRIFKIK